MKIALIADIHANLPALEAVLAHATRRGAVMIWNLGDFVGYGAFPDECVKATQVAGALSILGNYDIKALAIPEKGEQMRAKKSPEKFLAFQWAYEHLSKPSRAFLRALPEDRRFEAEGWRVHMTHASPGHTKNEHLSPDTPDERLRELAALTPANLVLVGHSHQPFKRQVDGPQGGVWFVNPGSVGRPDDGDPRAAYAILTLEGGRLDAELLRVEYDVARAAAAIRANGLPEAFAQMIEQGRDLKWVQTHNVAGDETS